MPSFYIILSRTHAVGTENVPITYEPNWAVRARPLRTMYSPLAVRNHEVVTRGPAADEPTRAENGGDARGDSRTALSQSEVQRAPPAERDRARHENDHDERRSGAATEDERAQ